MIAYENIKKIVANAKPSMAWDGKEPFEAWQERARAKLCELVGLDKMIPCEPEYTEEWTHKEEGFTETRFQIQTEPGYFVPCHILVPDGAKRPEKTFICLQGHTKGMHVSMNRTLFEGEDVSDREDDEFCLRAVREGYVAVALEQRNFGERGGTPGGPDCYAESVTNLLIGRCTIGERVWDVMRLIDLLLERYADTVDRDNIYIMGNSGGGTATTYAAAIDLRIAGAIPSCAVCSFASSIGAMHHCACNYVPRVLEYFDMGELISLIAPRKLVVVNGEKDNISPIGGAYEVVAVGKKAYAAAGVPERIAHVVGPEGHRFYADIAYEAFKKM